MAGFSSAYRSFVGVGRPDEAIAGKFVQHYGFRSIPTANTELLTLQYGFNNFSIAENDGSGPQALQLQEGDVAIYRPTDDGTLPLAAVFLVKEAGSIKAQVFGSDNVTIVTNPGGEVNLGEKGAATYYLVNENFLTQIFNAHTHTGGVLPGALTGPPVVITPVLPITTETTSAN